MLAPAGGTADTKGMNLATAALLAFIGSLVLTILLALDFVTTVMGVVRDVVPVLAMLRSLIVLFASLTATVFFFAFHKSNSR